MTVGLLAVVVYLYTVVAFNFFRKFYNKSEDEDEPDMKCDDMMTVSGGLGGVQYVDCALGVSARFKDVLSSSRSVTCFTCTSVCALAAA